MTTEQTAKQTKTKYFIQYVHNNKQWYYELIRTADLAILYANEDENNVKLHCWVNNIPASEVTIW